MKFINNTSEGYNQLIISRLELPMIQYDIKRVIESLRFMCIREHIVGDKYIYDLPTIITEEYMKNSLLRAGCQLHDIATNDNVIKLYRSDLIDNKTDIDDIDIYKFKSSVISRDEIRKASIIVFIDTNGELKILKQRN